MNETPQLPMNPRRRLQIPMGIWLLIAIDLLLVLLYVADTAAGKPNQGVSLLLDLNGEGNLPTWFASVQWLMVAALVGVFAWSTVRLRNYASWLLVPLPLVFVALSMDEVAQLHEKIGNRSDALLPGATREGTAFAVTGVWMFVLGIPFAIGFGVAMLALRRVFSRAPGAMSKVVVGMGLMLFGAIGVETLANVTTAGSLHTAQIAAEELCELLGATIVLWGAFVLADSTGLYARLLEVRRTEPVVQASARPVMVSDQSARSGS